MTYRQHKFLIKLLGLILMCLGFVLTAAVEKLAVTPLDQWTRNDTAEVNRKGAFLHVRTGEIRCPQKIKIKYGESLTVTVLYSGIGKVRLHFTEYDKNGIRLRSTWDGIVNVKDEEHTHSFVYDAGNRQTEYCEIKIDAADNPGLLMEDISLRRMSGPENALYSTVLNRALWKERTRGVNLIAGKKLRYIPEPNDFLTKEGDTDALDLTDGKISTDFRDYIWFDKKAVSWTGALNEVRIIADLGSVLPVDSLSIRIVGGRLHANDAMRGWFPNLFQVWISQDGKSFYNAAKMTKVMIAEKTDADWKTMYYLPEMGHDNAPSYVYPFRFEIHAEARYVVLIMDKPGLRLTTDEMVILQGDKNSGDFNKVYSTAPNTKLFAKEASVAPYYPEFYVPEGIILPNWFRFTDTRDVKTGAVTYTVDLPEQVKYIPEDESLAVGMKMNRQLTAGERKNGRAVYHFSGSKDYRRFAASTEYSLGPFYFQADGRIPEKERYAVFTTFVNGKTSGELRLPLRTVKIKPVPRAKHLLLSGTWFTPRIVYSWPNILESVGTVGFNAMGHHGKMTPKSQKYVNELRRQGFKVTATESYPFHTIATVTGAKDRDSVRCTHWKKVKSRNSLCPAYRGPYYEKLLRGLAMQINSVSADYIHLDYELWFWPELFQGCERCDALRKKHGLTWGQYAEWAMADFFKPLLAELRKSNPNARIGNYLSCASYLQQAQGRTFSAFGFSLLFPEYLDESHASYYGNNPNKVHDIVRHNYRKIGDPKRIAQYLTVGAGAYDYDRIGEAATWQLLEAYMNGAYGIVYFVDRSFVSPVDYWYVAEGMRAIVPFDEFLVKAGLDDAFKGSNPNLTYTLRRWKDDALVLIGNYNSSREASVFLPLKGVRSAADCFTGQTVPIDKTGIQLTVQGKKARLLHLKFK